MSSTAGIGTATRLQEEAVARLGGQQDPGVLRAGHAKGGRVNTMSGKVIVFVGANGATGDMDGPEIPPWALMKRA